MDLEKVAIMRLRDGAEISKRYYDKPLMVYPLYSCGFDRVGCIGCPMTGKKRFAEFARYPKYRNMYIRAFNKMLEVRKQRGKATQHANGLEVYHWWMQDGVLPGQLSFDGEDWL